MSINTQPPKVLLNGMTHEAALKAIMTCYSKLSPEGQQQYGQEKYDAEQAAEQRRAEVSTKLSQPEITVEPEQATLETATTEPITIVS